MGLICVIGGCSLKIDSTLGNEKEYVVFKCLRCGKKEILCSKEGKTLADDEKGMMVLDKMMNDPDFSLQCTIHSEFVRAHMKYTFNYNKCENEKSRIREKYGLPDGYVPADPVVLLEKGLWRPDPSIPSRENKSKSKKSSKPKSKAKPKKKGGEKPLRIEDGENCDKNYDDLFKVEIRISNKNDKKPDNENKGGEKYTSRVDLSKQNPFEPELTVEAMIARLERRMNKHVSREEYEKAAKLRDQIAKLKGEK